MSIPENQTNTAQEQKVHSSSTVLLKIGNKTIGVGQNATGTENFNLIPVSEGFGSIMPLEHAITEWSATVSIEKFLLRKASLVKMGIAASADGILSLPPINIEFIDAYTHDVITIFYSCTLQSREFTITQNAIVGERATWLALNTSATRNPKLPIYAES